MADLTERLLDPATFEATLADLYMFSTDMLVLVDVARELHRLLATAKAEGAADEAQKIANWAKDVQLGRSMSGAEATYWFSDMLDRRAAAIRKGLAARAGGGR